MRDRTTTPSALAGAFIGKRGTLEERFWRYVTKGEPDACWLWTGAKNNSGYGTIGLSGVNNMGTAHRVAWEIHRGPIAPGSVLCHRCDTPACVNPNHLFLGSVRDNVLDAVAKGRHRMPQGKRGEAHRSAKLTEQSVRRIWALRATHTVAEIAAMLGVRSAVIYAVLSGRTWKHISSVERACPDQGSAGCDDRVREMPEEIELAIHGAMNEAFHVGRRDRPGEPFSALARLRSAIVSALRSAQQERDNEARRLSDLLRESQAEEHVKAERLTTAEARLVEVEGERDRAVARTARLLNLAREWELNAKLCEQRDTDPEDRSTSIEEQGEVYYECASALRATLARCAALTLHRPGAGAAR